MTLVDAHAAATKLNISPATVRKWKQRGKVRQHGADHRGRALYDLDELADVESRGFLTGMGRPRHRAA